MSKYSVEKQDPGVILGSLIKVHHHKNFPLKDYSPLRFVEGIGLLSNDIYVKQKQEMSQNKKLSNFEFERRH